MKILTKAQMYSALGAGAFGNTVDQWLSVTQWSASSAADDVPEWGVRTMTFGGPCRLFCPTAEVASTFRQFESQGHRCQISPMVDSFATVTMFAEVYEGPFGLTLEGCQFPGKGAHWREAMCDRRSSWSGSLAWAILAQHLNPNSMDDLRILLDQYPEHVIEFSVLDRCFGTVPHRNAIIWEVRSY